MKDLIKALKIFLKYGNPDWPTHCEHDVMFIVDIQKKDVSKKDRKKLKKLGFHWDKDEETYYSYKFGSA